MNALTESRTIEKDGFQLIPALVNESRRIQLLDALGEITKSGRRNLLRSTAVLFIAHSPEVMECVGRFLKGLPQPRRALFFEKSADMNWFVPWHQDLTIEVRRKVVVEGFGPWSVKEGIHCVQPPAALLQQMVTIRLHLDDCAAENGALRVIPGSHREGRLSGEKLRTWTASNSVITCVASAGDALCMRPLLLHSSKRSQTDVHRRILHIEYAAFDLPAPLEWHV